MKDNKTTIALSEGAINQWNSLMKEAKQIEEYLAKAKAYQDRRVLIQGKLEGIIENSIHNVGEDPEHYTIEFNEGKLILTPKP